ncbi:MAG: hypothetical protein HYY16_18240 [Planctomycetes bacterium]|nr:hypothetical protein [Planctomycetota bacterium]
MKVILTSAIVALLAAGCSGGPLKQRPELAPPPAEPEPAEEPVVETQEAPRPPEATMPAIERDEVVEKPAPPSREDVVGWWISTEVRGPGSAGVRRVEMIFNRDGTYEGMAVIQEQDRLRMCVSRGKCVPTGLDLQMDLEDGRRERWKGSWEDHRLVLKDGESEVVLREAGGESSDVRTQESAR